MSEENIVVVTGARCLECGHESPGVVSLYEDVMYPFPVEVDEDQLEAMRGRGHGPVGGPVVCTGQMEPQIARAPASCPRCGTTPWSGGRHEGCDFTVRHG